MNRKILRIQSREILDSRGNPTVEAIVFLECGIIGVASCPSGASTGTFEAVELRDGDNRYLGKGVQKAVDNINNIISPALKGVDCSNTLLIDEILIELDATENKSYLGANATLPVSLACARAASTSFGLPLYKFLGGTSAHIMPVPMMNVINGGAHAPNNLDIQEFMIVPFGASSFKEALRQCSEVYHTLGNLLHSRGLSSSVGDEGGYAPSLCSDEDAISLIVEAIETTGYNTSKDFSIALDAAASEWALSDGYNLPLEWSTGTSKYKMPKRVKEYTTEELITYWSDLIKKYPISSIEDGLAEDDRNGWIQLTSAIGKQVQLVGDDLYVTNSQRLRNGIRDQMGNCILIKPNQIGTLSETLETISLAQRNGYKTIISHRSGETEDTFIADLAVSVNSGQIKAGAPCRSERVAKYNRLLRIESNLKSQACYGERANLYS